MLVVSVVVTVVTMRSTAGFVVLPTMLVSMAMPGHSPHEKRHARDQQEATHDVTLLALDLVLELEADEGDHSGQNERGEDVASGGEQADTSDATERPSLGSRHDRQRGPVIGKD